MRIDAVSIFPDYFSPLDLSLIGRARAEGLIGFRAWDLREFTDDRHRTVDDTPYGGGAGMVMRAEPWGRALDAVAASAPDGAPEPPLIVVPGPGGDQFTQAEAYRLAAEPWLVFACGRYEGIDERVYAYAEATWPGRVRVLSLGDYVLNGGEVAALALIEAVVRLLPGVIGNAESLAEESHTDGLLEYPMYTHPPAWRGMDVPAVLLSGDHAAVAAWRREQRLARTAARRPDLLHPSVAVTGFEAGQIRLAEPGDCAELFTLMRASWVAEGRDNGSFEIPPLVESYDDLRASLDAWRTWVVRDHGRLVASVRARLDGSTWDIGRLMVAEDLRGRGLGRFLLEFAEAQAPVEATHAALFTGAISWGTLRRYRKAGYRPRPGGDPDPAYLAKRLQRR